MGALTTTRINDHTTVTTPDRNHVPAGQAAAITRITAVVIAGTPVKAIRCRRCTGSGSTVYTWNNFGICRNCGGDGVVPSYTKAQKEAIAKRAADTHAAYVAVEAALKGRHHEARGIARDAYGHLRDNAPARFDRMVTSVLTGRTDAVIDALIAYATDADIYTDFARAAAAREGK